MTSWIYVQLNHTIVESLEIPLSTPRWWPCKFSYSNQLCVQLRRSLAIKSKHKLQNESYITERLKLVKTNKNIQSYKKTTI